LEDEMTKRALRLLFLRWRQRLCPHLQVDVAGSTYVRDHTRFWGACLTCGKRDVTWTE
jgi:hypothetical protein